MIATQTTDAIIGFNSYTTINVVTWPGKMKPPARHEVTYWQTEVTGVTNYIIYAKDKSNSIECLICLPPKLQTLRITQMTLGLNLPLLPEFKYNTNIITKYKSKGLTLALNL